MAGAGRRAATLVGGGCEFDMQKELRRGYNNFSGDLLGTEGTLRRDENDIALPPRHPG